MSRTEPQERDALPFGRLLAVGLTAIAIAVAACAWAVWMERPLPRQLTRSPPPSARARALEDALYDAASLEGPPPASRSPSIAERAEQLDRWSWADRTRGLVNMPIDEAMALWLQSHGGPGRPEDQR